MTNAASILLIAVGLFFMLIASIGFIRLPDMFCRMHVLGVLDTLGAPLMLLGAAVHLGITLSAGKLVLAICFLLATNPLVGHLLAGAALDANHVPPTAGRLPDAKPD
jgi:multicomponent Na+:H+ antiporter subunit G